MNISEIGIKCSMCIYSMSYIPCDCDITTNNCSKCDNKYYYTENHEYVLYCVNCKRYYCRFCEIIYHKKKPCVICKLNSCATIKCTDCNQLVCIICTRYTKQKYKCVKCANLKYHYINNYINDYCLDCIDNISILCNICNIKKCKCRIKIKKIDYIQEGVSQLLNICNDCEQDKMLLLKSRYLLILYSNDINILNCKYKTNMNMRNIIKTLLLLANCRNKYISKVCFIYYIIPQYIKNIIKEYIIETRMCKIGEILIKCNCCLKYVPIKI